MKYYEAYEERYKTIHKKGYSWSSDEPTPIVLKIIKVLKINKNDKILEIGCGEGRDAVTLLKNGYNLLATDISLEAINYCKSLLPKHANKFKVLDCLNDNTNDKYHFIYAIAVIHMLVLDEDRHKFYDFIYKHLDDDGFALICSMGDGKTEYQSDISDAFKTQNRKHFSGDVMVAATSCRMVSFETLEKEIETAHLRIVKKGITESLPDFNSLMFTVVQK